MKRSVERAMYSECLAMIRRLVRPVRPYAAVALVVTAGVGAALWSSYPAVGAVAVVLALTLASFCLLLLLGSVGLSPFSNGVTSLVERGSGRPGPPPSAEELLRAADALDVQQPPGVEPRTGSSVAAPVTARTRPDGRILTQEFEAAWRARMVRMTRGTDEVDFAALYALDPDELELDWRRDGVVARYEDRRIGKWLSRAAFVADVSAVRELAARLPAWRHAPEEERERALGALRLCLDRCPVCDGEVVLDVATAGPGAGADREAVLVSRCTGCNAGLFEAECDSATLQEMVAHTPPSDGQRTI